MTDARLATQCSAVLPPCTQPPHFTNTGHGRMACDHPGPCVCIRPIYHACYPSHCVWVVSMPVYRGLSCMTPGLVSLCVGPGVTLGVAHSHGRLIHACIQPQLSFGLPRFSQWVGAWATPFRRTIVEGAVSRDDPAPVDAHSWKGLGVQ